MKKITMPLWKEKVVLKLDVLPGGLNCNVMF